jgi:hypothetical protein
MRVEMDCTCDWYSKSIEESSAAFSEAVNVRADSLAED